MSAQLSLFDWVSSTENAAVPESAEVAAHAAKQIQLRRQALLEERRRLERACQRRTDEIRPLGDLAQLVLARYDLMIRCREEKERQRREQPRRSIRVLTAPRGSQAGSVANSNAISHRLPKRSLAACG